MASIRFLLSAVAVINTMASSNLGKEGFISAYRLHTIPLQGKPGQELEAGTWRQKLKQRPSVWSYCCLLACSLWLAQPVFFIQSEPPDQDASASQSGLGPPSFTINQENAPQACHRRAL